MKKPVALIIMDGFGESKNTDGNAIASSNTPNLDKTEIKPLERLKRKLRKLAHKKARQNRKKVV